MKAFLSLRQDKRFNFNEESITNLIVIGDSRYEMEAGEELCK